MNKDDYKKIIDQIRPPEDLKYRTIEKIKKLQKRRQEAKRKFLVASVAVIVICFCTIGIYKIENNSKNEHLVAINTETKIQKINNELPRFKNMQELKDALSVNSSSNLEKEEISKSSRTEAFQDSTISDKNETAKEDFDYSKTNTQVENVDEADTVKTDGKYIYYVSNNAIWILDADTLDVKSKIKDEKEEGKNYFSPNEIFLKDNILIALGNNFAYEEIKTTTSFIEESDIATKDVANIRNTPKAKAIVYDISNKENPTIKREIELDGYYSNSRMIGENVYFISHKSAYYYDQTSDEYLLPRYKDSLDLNKEKIVECTDIAYFRDTESNVFTLVAGFNINDNNPICLETFFGASETVYASEKNLYLAQVCYNKESYNIEKSTIYKFNLENAQIILNSKCDINGDLKNQFSMDEYDENLRVATTSYDKEGNTTNQLYIFDEDLKEIGKIENLAEGEKIYAVRFIGKIGYVVTFKQIDPLLVIDLSNPNSPQVKGELKIPGYSSYLHPYDDTHIIGIGYNTKSNGYGGITNSNMKMSMFDVSDLENPKEMFSIDIGNDYSYSEVMENHKALFYYKNKNLIGFPITLREHRSNNDKNALILYKISLEEGFKEYGRIEQNIYYKTNIRRAIYISDNLYTLSDTKIISYDLNTIQKIKEVEYNPDEI